MLFLHFQCGGAWPFLVDGVLCLVRPVNDRDLGLLNSVKYDSYVITCQRDIVSKVRVQCILAGKFTYAVTSFLNFVFKLISLYR